MQSEGEHPASPLQSQVINPELTSSQINRVIYSIQQVAEVVVLKDAPLALPACSANDGVGQKTANEKEEEFIDVINWDTSSAGNNSYEEDIE